jgi:predicted small metal-binding protein
MKTRLTCPCGTTIKAVDEDELVELTQQHLAAEHPDMSYGRDEILFIAT